MLFRLGRLFRGGLIQIESFYYVLAIRLLYIVSYKILLEKATLKSRPRWNGP